MSGSRSTLVPRLLDRATRPPWLTAFALLQVLALAFVGVRYHHGLDGLTREGGAVVTGDFPAFRTAGLLLARGRGGELYDLALQRGTQRALLGDNGDEAWQPYAYPPLYAVVMAALAGVSDLAAFRVHALWMLASLLLGLSSLRGALPAIGARRAGWLTAGLLVVGFTPVFRTAIGGQNTALTLGLFMAALGAVASEKPVRAGLWIGLLGYKPQLLPLLALWLLASRSYVSLGVMAAVCLAHYALGAVLCGPGWPLAMLDMLGVYQALESADNLSTHASATALARQLLGGPPGWALAGVVAMGLGWLVVTRARREHDRVRSLAIAWLCGMLVSPHLQYYDVALVLAPLLVGVDRALARPGAPSRAARLLLCVGFFAYPVYALGPVIGVQPLALWLGLSLAWLMRLDGAATERPGTSTGT